MSLCAPRRRRSAGAYQCVSVRAGGSEEKFHSIYRPSLGPTPGKETRLVQDCTTPHHPYPLPPISPNFPHFPPPLSLFRDTTTLIIFTANRKHELVKISVFRLGARKFERRKTVYKFRKYQIPGIADLEVGGFFLMFYSFGGPLKQYSMGYGFGRVWRLEFGDFGVAGQLYDLSQNGHA